MCNGIVDMWYKCNTPWFLKLKGLLYKLWLKGTTLLKIFGLIFLNTYFKFLNSVKCLETIEMGRKQQL